MFEDFIEYQKLDRELRQLKHQLSSDPARQELNSLAQATKSLQNKLVELDNQASTSIKEYEKCRADYTKLFATFETFQSKDASKLTPTEINNGVTKLNNLVNQLSNMERLLSAQAENISSILKSFDYCKKNIVSNKQKYLDTKQKCEGQEKDLAPQMEKIKKAMAQMESKLDPKILSHYKSLCQEKTWPVFVPLTGGACGGCTMGLSAALLNKVKENGYIECEQCRRYIYNPK